MAASEVSCYYLLLTKTKTTSLIKQNKYFNDNVTLYIENEIPRLKISSQEYSLIISKHNEKLTSIIENQR